MKYRLDHVTNSSSSSFIFGEPGGHTLTVEDVRNQVLEIAKALYNNVKQVKEGLDVAGIVVDYSTDKNITRTYEEWANKLDKDAGLHVGATWDTIKYDTYSFYNKLKKIVETSEVGELVSLWDIHGKEFTDSQKEAGELLYWYEDSPSESYGGSIDDVNSMLNFCNANYGEVALLGECGDLPDALADELMNRLKYSCNHMG